MKVSSIGLVGCFLVAACSKGNDEPAPSALLGSGDATYAADIEALCDVIARSNSTELDPNDRMFQIATWLGANLKSSDARKFLAKIQPLDGEAKATALEAEAKRVGLAGCALAAEWRQPSR